MNSNIEYRCCICGNWFPSAAVIFRNDDKNICFNCHKKSCMNQMNVMPDRSILEAEIKRFTAENAALRAQPDEHPASNDDVWNMLQYIANSPAQEHGGFNPSAVRAAHKAIYWIKELCANIAALRNEGEIVEDEE